MRHILLLPPFLLDGLVADVVLEHNTANPTFMRSDSTLMRSAQSCEVYAGKCCCSRKHLNKDYPFRTSYLVHSIPIQRNSTLNKCFTVSAIAAYPQKCCFLLTACPHFVQMLVLALPSIISVIIQRERLCCPHHSNAAGCRSRNCR